MPNERNLPAGDSNPAARIRSAVLVPVFRRDDGDLRILVVRRGARGIHGGQLAFPGGKCEPGDRSPLETALREAEEEVGLAAGEVEVLATLPVIDTLTTGFLIHPFLARIRPPRGWRCQAEEIVEVFELRVRDLSRPEMRREETVQFPTWPQAMRIAFYQVGDHRLWGASFRILEPLLPRLLAGEWPV